MIAQLPMKVFVRLVADMSGNVVTISVFIGATGEKFVTKLILENNKSSL